MKRKLIVITIALCILMVLGMLKHKEKATIICATDLHYISDRINDRGELFQKIVNSTDGKLAYYSEEIIDAFLKEEHRYMRAWLRLTKEYNKLTGCYLLEEVDDTAICGAVNMELSEYVGK